MLKYQTHIDIESGTNLHVTTKPPVTAPIRSLSFSGNSTQTVTVQGKNLCPDIPSWSLVGNAYRENGYIIIPDISSNAYIDIDWNLLSNRYFVSLIVNSSNISSVVLSTDYFDNTNTLLGSNANALDNPIGENLRTWNVLQPEPYVTYIANSKKIRLMVKIWNIGVYQNPFKFKDVMFYKETAAYEPFVPNSPSPKYPSEILSVPSSFNLTVCGKNLFDNLSVQNLFINDSGSTIPNLPYLLSGYIKVKPNSQYTFKTNAYQGSEQIIINRIVYYGADKTFMERNNTGYFTSEYTYTIPENVYFIRMHLRTAAATTAINISTFQTYQTQLEYGSSAAVYTSYVGTTTAFSIKDTDGNLYPMRSLPNIKDNVANGKINILVKELIVTDSTGWYYASYNSTIAGLAFSDMANAWGYQQFSQTNMRCNIAVPNGDYIAPCSCYTHRQVDRTQIILLVPKTEVGITDSETVAEQTTKARTWITNQIAAHGYIIFTYPLATPLSYNLDSAEATKFNDFTSHQYETNVFTDAAVQPTINCEIRKMGNRAYVLTDLTDENGNILADENGDYIGGLF